MRTKAVFSVFGRRLPSGKLVYYYQCYDDKGKRQWAKSTGLTKKTEAAAYCMKLFRDGLLVPAPKVPAFAEFTDGFWDFEKSWYLKWRRMHDPLEPGTVDIYRNSFENHIKDYFAKFGLDEITPNVIENWLIAMSEKNLKSSTVNLVYRTLKLMLGEAVKSKLIAVNPCAEVKELKAAEPERDILTVEEVRRLFPAD